MLGRPILAEVLFREKFTGRLMLAVPSVGFEPVGINRKSESERSNS